MSRTKKVTRLKRQLAKARREQCTILNAINRYAKVTVLLDNGSSIELSNAIVECVELFPKTTIRIRAYSPVRQC